MPKTIVVRQTWRCPTCDSEWDTAILDGQICSRCEKGVVRRETDPTRCGTLTVMGEEDIESEIEREDVKRSQQEWALQTLAEKVAYRAQRHQDIAKAIIEARKREFVP